MLADDHWLFGAGLAGYKKTVAPYHRRKDFEIFQYPHNLFLALWTELGLLGLGSFLWLLTTIFVKAIRAAKQLPVTSYQLLVTALAALVALLVHGLVDVPFFKNDLAVLFWLIVGMIILNGETARQHDGVRM